MKLFYRKYGEGPVLMILHGLFGSSDNWISIAKQLAARHTVILPDMRNHGKSPHSGTHDYESMSNDVHELAVELQVEKFFLAGHSMGGKTAIHFALKWPEMLYGLLVADISPFRGETEEGDEYRFHRTILETMLTLDPSALTTREDAEKLLQEKGFDERTAGFILKNLHRTHKGFEWKINAPSLMKNLNEITSALDRDIAYKHRVTGFPVIFLKGEKSDYLPADHYADILKLFPAAEITTIKNAGHWLHADNPGDVVKNFERLLE
jgi:pimeloyl-ACP methyl ester carboxylesterase